MMANCIFCKISQKEIQSNIVYEDDICLAFLDLSQVTMGHTLVVPKQHYTNILDIDVDVSSHIFGIATKLAKQIKENLNAKGINILSNANEIAYQSVMHFHLHIIPRYNQNEGFKVSFENNQDKYNLSDIVKNIVE